MYHSQSVRKWKKRDNYTEQYNLNRDIKELKHLVLIEQNDSVQEYLENLASTEATEYSLWEATGKLKRLHHHKPLI